MGKDRNIYVVVAEQLAGVQEDLTAQLEENFLSIELLETRVADENGATDRLRDLMYSRGIYIQQQRDLLRMYAASLLMQTSNQYLCTQSLTHNEHFSAHKEFLCASDGFKDATSIVLGLSKILPQIRIVPAVHRVVIEAREMADQLFQ